MGIMGQTPLWISSLWRAHSSGGPKGHRLRLLASLLCERVQAWEVVSSMGRWVRSWCPGAMAQDYSHSLPRRGEFGQASGFVAC